MRKLFKPVTVIVGVAATVGVEVVVGATVILGTVVAVSYGWNKLEQHLGKPLFEIGLDTTTEKSSKREGAFPRA